MVTVWSSLPVVPVSSVTKLATLCTEYVPADAYGPTSRVYVYVFGAQVVPRVRTASPSTWSVTVTQSSASVVG